MRIAVIGTGYLGVTTGVCFAELGNNVICSDLDENKISKLNNGIPTIYEPGLKDMLERNLKEKRIKFTTSNQEAVEHSDVIFICVDTPMGEQGEANLNSVKAVARDIGKYMNCYKVIVDKSTVPVGTAEVVRSIIKENQATPVEFDMASNPEFLREGNAVQDFLVPDRIAVGTDNEKARKIMAEIYKSIERTNHPIIFTDVKSAEMIKYASNSMLATRISFMNEIARLCEKAGADVKAVARGMGLDNRIGPRFLQAGAGYGGSCFPKDIRAFVHTAKQHGVDFKILKAVDEVNEEQKKTIVPKIKKLVPDLKDKTIGIWGLAFKPKTDDIREAPSLVIINHLLEEGARIKAFDPEAKEHVQKIFPDVEFVDTPYEAAKGTHSVVLVTEWNEFRGLDLSRIKNSMKEPNFVDGRNVFDPKKMKEEGFNYYGVGR